MNSSATLDHKADASRLADQPAEVMHYTTAEGLLGVIQRQELWATRSDFLNDREERKGFIAIGLPRICEAVVDLNLPSATAVERKAATNQLVESLASLVFEDHAYFASLSSFPKYDIDHGLLSQWRGYGKDGGYAIVFDRQKLDRALIQEFMSHDYRLLKMDDVAYYGGQTDDLDGPSVAQLMNHANAIRESLNLVPSEQRSSVFEAFIMSSALYKHRGFREEAEVRIVAVPTSEKIRAVEKCMAIPSSRTKKAINFRSREGLIIPYIPLKLTSDQYPELPISRIIVGPHPDADRRQLAVEALLAERCVKAEVFTSGIPFLG